jgi:hypothetical protein
VRYLIAVIDNASRSANSDERAAIDEFNDRLRANGNWVMACGIDGPNTATVIDNRSDAGLFNDGPLIAADEYVSGFWIIDAENRDAALKLAAAGSKACNRKVEVRPLLG